MKYKKLAFTNAEDLIFGKALYPVTTPRGLIIGNGTVYPELNFTLPPMSIEEKTFPQIKEHYRQIVTEALKRAIDLNQKGVVFEFETLLEMTLQPELGTELIKIMNDICEDFYQNKGIPSEIRLTPNDTRDYERPVLMRNSRYLENMWRLFEDGAKAGGNLLSIESTGGKELCDEALMNCNIKDVVYALAVLGVRDMKFIWSKITDIAEKTGTIAGGDTACGFGNTAMVLAEKKYIPKIFAAIVRIVTIVRTLVAIEEGAKGPDKDCGYEGPFLKAITGTPLSMEGKTAACAHLSPLGNIASAYGDLWSNESVANSKLLGGMAPTVYFEQLTYDCRLMNQSILKGQELMLRDLLVSSDMFLDPQAFILAPENVIAISQVMVDSSNYIEAAKMGALKGLELIEKAYKEGSLLIDEREEIWIDMMKNDLSEIPADEGLFTDDRLPTLNTDIVKLKEYGL